MTNTIKLSSAQVSAMECRNWDEEPATRAAWDGGSLLVLPSDEHERYRLWSELNEASNAEDAQAEIQQDKYARRASTSLGIVAGKVLRAWRKGVIPCAICEQADGAVNAIRDDKSVLVCAACFTYETI